MINFNITAKDLSRQGISYQSSLHTHNDKFIEMMSEDAHIIKTGHYMLNLLSIRGKPV